MKRNNKSNFTDKRESFAEISIPMDRRVLGGVWWGGRVENKFETIRINNHPMSV
jgi:hypothetical protein